MEKISNVADAINELTARLAQSTQMLKCYTRHQLRPPYAKDNTVALT